MAADTNQPLTLPAALLTILLCFVFGANPTAIKVSLTGMGKFTTAGLRFALAAVVVSLWAWFSNRPFALTRREVLPICVISVLFTTQLALFYLGASMTSASHSALLSNMVPFFVSVLAHFFIPGDTLSRRKTIGLLLGFAGVALIIADPDITDSRLLHGDLIILGGVLIWACNAVYTKTVIDRFHPFQVVLYPMLFSIPVLFMAAWLWDGAMIARLDWPITAALLYQSLICAAIGFVVWNSLLQRFGASSLHSFVFIMPFSGVAAGALLLDEPVTGAIISGGLLVTLGVTLVNLKVKTVLPAFPPARD